MVMMSRQSVSLQKALWVAGATCALGLVAAPVYATPTIYGYVMEVQMTPAVCLFDNQGSKKRKCLEGYSLNITGLYPETTTRECQTASSSGLSPLQTKVVARVMPDEHARRQLWAEIGGCVPMNASQYFRNVINYAERLKIPADLTSSENKTAQLSVLRSQFQRLNPGLPADGLRFNCRSHRQAIILTEVKVCYKANGKYKACAENIQENCPSSFAIKGSY